MRSFLIALAIPLTLALARPTHASVQTFASDTTSWNVYTADPASGPATLLGTPEYVALNSGSPSGQLPGTVSYNFPVSGWPADLSSISGAHWIWNSGITASTLAPDFQEYYFSRQFTLSGTITAASISVGADDLAQVFVDGTSVGTYGTVTVASPTSQSILQAYNILPFLHPGVNTITVMGENGPGSFSGTYVPGQPVTYQINPAGVVFGGSITTIPEPASLAILAAGFSILTMRRRRRLSSR